MRYRSIAMATLVALLAGCARVVPPPPPPPAPPVARPVPPPEPPPPPASSDWRDWPATPGTWTYRQDARGSIAMFGTPGADADLTLRCDRGARALYLSRHGMGLSGTMAVRTSTLARTLPLQPTGGTPAYLATRLSPDDRLLDAMGYSRGRFIVEVTPLPVLVVPAWAEVLRVAEDCRG